MTGSTPSRLFGRTKRVTDGVTSGFDHLGEQTRFYARTVGSLGEALVRYRGETIRLIAQMGLGSGALAMIGGATVVIGFLTFAGGTVIAIQGYSSLSGIGVQAFAGFVSAFVNIRIVAPLVAAIGLAATIGAGATAQLGAMRINEEIDALEVMGIKAVAYLTSTRLAAGVIVVVPLFCVAVIMAVVGTRLSVTMTYGQSTGVYDHYFNTFLNPVDLIWSSVQVVVDGHRRDAHPHLLRVHRIGRTGRRGGSRRARYSHVAHHGELRDRGRLTGDLRSERQFPPLRVTKLTVLDRCAAHRH